MFTGTVQPLSMIPYTYAAFYHTYSSTPSTHPKKRTRRTPVKGHSGTSTPGINTAQSRHRPGHQRNLAPVSHASEGSYLYRFRNITSSSYPIHDQISSSKNNRDNHSSSDSGGAFKCTHESTASYTTQHATSACQMLSALNSQVAGLWSKFGCLPPRTSGSTSHAAARPVGFSGGDVSAAKPADLGAGRRTLHTDQAPKGSSNTCHIVCKTY